MADLSHAREGLISVLAVDYNGGMRKPKMPYRTLRPLFKLMIDRDLTWRDLRDNVRMQPEILSGIAQGKVPRLYVIQRIMAWLDCKYTDVVGWDIW